jgi:hypothetical protein
MQKQELEISKLSNELLSTFYQFLKDIGLGKEVEALKKQNTRHKIVKVFNQLVTDNPYFPAEADVDLMLRAFMKDVIYGGVDMRYRNIRGLCLAFKDFASKPHLKEAFRVNKELPPKHERTIEEWSDEEIERAYENMGKLGLIYESHPFYDRIKQQAKERGLV